MPTASYSASLRVPSSHILNSDLIQSYAQQIHVHAGQQANASLIGHWHCASLYFSEVNLLFMADSMMSRMLTSSRKTPVHIELMLQD